jgi:hypothetical protein
MGPFTATGIGSARPGGVWRVRSRLSFLTSARDQLNQEFLAAHPTVMIVTSLQRAAAASLENSSADPLNRKSAAWVMAIATRSRYGSLNQIVP